MRGILITAFAASILAAGAARAGPLPDGGATAQEIAAVLQAKGYRAQIGTDRQGDPLITSAGEGSEFKVVFYGCKAGRCHSIEFSVAYDLPDGIAPAKINDWNRKKRFGRAFVDEVNDPFLKMDVDLERGSTTESVANNLDTWLAVLRDFRQFIKE
jgi:hypothetical protein